jgi:hypothetical protein
VRSFFSQPFKSCPAPSGCVDALSCARTHHCTALLVARSYASLALFSLLRFPMSFLPMLITMVVNALVALRRIGAFLAKEESTLSKVGGAPGGRFWSGWVAGCRGCSCECALS